MSLPPKCTSTTCYSYRSQRFTEVFINYNNISRYQYNRLVPDYFRRYFPECGFTNYREALNGISSGNFNSVALSSNGTKGIAVSNSNAGIYYTSNSGATWTQSNITTGNFNSVALSSNGIKGTAVSNSNTGIYYTSNSGATWTQSNITTGNFNSVALSSD